MSVEDLKRQWPRPRVGERVKLWGAKHIGEVVAVRGAKDALKLMKEVQAMRFGPDRQAAYGPHWMEIYYQADVLVRGGIRVVEPSDVEIVLPPD